MTRVRLSKRTGGIVLASALAAGTAMAAPDLSLVATENDIPA